MSESVSPKGIRTPLKGKKEEPVVRASAVKPAATGAAAKPPMSATPRASVPTPVDPPAGPTPTLRYAAAAAVAIPKPDSSNESILLDVCS